MEARLSIVGAVLLAAVLATAGVAGAFAPGATQAQQAQQDSNKTVQVSGSGQVQAEADRAVIDLAVLTRGEDVETARQRLSENTSKLREALIEMGINESQIQTSYYDISSDRYGPREDKPKYRAVHSFVVTVENTSRVGETIDTAVNNGASEIDGVEFTISPEKREELRHQALEQAMDDARGKAGTIAGASDLVVDGVSTVSTTNYRHSPYSVETAAAGGDAAGTSIDSGPVNVRASVSVVYGVSTNTTTAD
jgi:uncharacterized protein YggE